MQQAFDYFGQPEYPAITLCNPDQVTELYSLGLCYNTKLTLKFNALSEFTFDFPRSIDGNQTTLDPYPYIQNKRLVLVEGHGYFQIVNVEEDFEGSVDIKHVTCQSLQSELIQKRVSVYGGTKKLYDIISPTGTIIQDMLDLAPTWSAGTFDAELLVKYRTFDVSNSNIYNFLQEEVAPAFECVFIFDTVNKTIGAKTYENATTNTDIFLSFDNVVSKAKFEEKSDEIVTALSVFGGGDLTINPVNPLGTSYIYNFDYYKTSEWMSSGLISALTAWEALCAAKQVEYSDLLTTLKGYKTEMIDLQGDLDVLQAEYKALETTQSVRIQGGLDYSDVLVSMAAKQAEIDAKNTAIVNKQIDIDSTTASLDAISGQVSFESNFTADQLLELDGFVFQNTFQNKNIILTDTMTLVERQDAAQSLYDHGLSVLERVSQPRYEISMDAINYIALSDFSVFTNQTTLGSEVVAELKDGTYVDTVILEIEFSFDDPMNFKMTLSNRLRLDNGQYKFSDLMGKVVETGTNVSFNNAAWSDWNDNYKDDVSTFITSSLDATLNNIVSNSDQEVKIDQTGLRARKSDGAGGYLDNQLWITNNVIAFSDDGFQTAKLALGEVSTPDGGTAFGLIADYVVGRMLAGNALQITNEGNNFTLDQNGAVLNDASFTIENSVSKIMLDPTNGIKIQKKSVAYPSITIGTTTTKVASNVAGTLFSHAVASGGDRLLIVTISAARSGGASIISVTYAGIAMTPAVSIGSGDNYSGIWYLVNPPVGTANVSINTPSGTYIEVGASNFSGVDQANPIRNWNWAQGTSTTPSVGVTSAVNDYVVDSLNYWNNSTTFTPAVGQASVYNITSDGAYRGAMSRKNGAAGTVTMNWSGASATWLITAVSIKKSSSSTYTDMLSLDTNGNAIFSGALSAVSGDFSGEITADAGYIGSLTIDGDGLSDSYGNYLRPNSLKWGALTINGATATFDGTIYANQISGEIVDSQIATGLDASKLTVGYLSADRISGGTISGIDISWPGVSMYSPGYGWSKIEFGKLELVEDSGEDYITMDAGYMNIYAANAINISGGSLEIEVSSIYSHNGSTGGYGTNTTVVLSSPYGNRTLIFHNGICTSIT